VLQHIFNLHLREATRIDVLGNEATMDLLSDTREMAVCFADLVGFTSLGEQIPADELGAIAERLNEITVGLVEPPVRLVKTIGDAVMLVSTEPKALIDLGLKMVEIVDQEDEGFPRLSVGIEIGEVLARGGDIYGPPVNHASRLCDAARPGTVLVTTSLKDRFADDYDWTEVGRRRFKGIDKPLELYRVRAKGERQREKREQRAARSR
jgi:adenylate cyclase